MCTRMCTDIGNRIGNVLCEWKKFPWLNYQEGPFEKQILEQARATF